MPGAPRSLQGGHVDFSQVIKFVSVSIPVLAIVVMVVKLRRVTGRGLLLQVLDTTGNRKVEGSVSELELELRRRRTPSPSINISVISLLYLTKISMYQALIKGSTDNYYQVVRGAFDGKLTNKVSYNSWSPCFAVL